MSAPNITLQPPDLTPDDFGNLVDCIDVLVQMNLIGPTNLPKAGS